jgi:hypothetical protein
MPPRNDPSSPARKTGGAPRFLKEMSIPNEPRVRGV